MAVTCARSVQRLSLNPVICAHSARIIAEQEMI